MEQIDFFALVSQMASKNNRLPFKVIPLGIVVVAVVEIQSRKGWPRRCLFASQEKIFQSFEHSSLMKYFYLFMTLCEVL